MCQRAISSEKNSVWKTSFPNAISLTDRSHKAPAPPFPHALSPQSRSSSHHDSPQAAGHGREGSRLQTPLTSPSPSPGDRPRAAAARPYIALVELGQPRLAVVVEDKDGFDHGGAAAAGLAAPAPPPARPSRHTLGAAAAARTATRRRGPLAPERLKAAQRRAKPHPVT